MPQAASSPADPLVADLPPVRRRLGVAIRDARMGLDPPMTQRDLAHAVGVHQPSVSAWELGKTLPAPSTMLTLARLLQLDLSDMADEPVRSRREPEALAG